jgi:hypothetical protein
VAALSNPDNPVSRPIIPAMQAAAAPLSLLFEAARAQSPSRHYAALGQLRPAFQRARVIACGFGCSRTHRILSGNEPEGGVENVFGLTGRAQHSGRGAPSLR